MDKDLKKRVVTLANEAGVDSPEEGEIVEASTRPMDMRVVLNQSLSILGKEVLQPKVGVTLEQIIAKFTDTPPPQLTEP